MRTKYLAGLMAGVAMSAMAGAAQAGPMIEFRFDNPLPSGASNPMPVTLGGLTATTSCSKTFGCVVVQDSEGLGVTSSLFDANDVDGFGLDERLYLTFSDAITGLAAKVKLHRIDFENVDDNDESALIVDGAQQGFGLIGSGLGIPGASADCSGVDDGSPNDECEVSVDLASGNYIGDSFGFGDAISGLRSLDNNDNFRVESLVVSQVPVPATLGLMGLGLGLLTLGARRRKG